MNKVTMASTEYQALSDKIDKLSEKFDNSFARLDDGKLSKGEYERAHKALEVRVLAIKQRMDSETKAADAEHLRIETAAATRYDKLEVKFDTLNTKLDGLKDTMNTRFDNLRDQASATRRGWIQLAVGVLAGILGSGGIGSLIYYLVHTVHP